MSFLTPTAATPFPVLLDAVSLKALAMVVPTLINAIQLGDMGTPPNGACSYPSDSVFSTVNNWCHYPGVASSSILSIGAGSQSPAEMVFRKALALEVVGGGAE